MYLNLVQIAESFGVSERTVETWIRHEGLPHTPDRGRLLFDRAQVAGWAAARGLAAQAGFLAPEAAFATGWRIEPLLRAGGIWRGVRESDVAGTYRRIADSLPGTPPPLRSFLAERLAAPGGVTLAPVGEGLALPHPSRRVALGRDSGVVAILLLGEPLRTAEPVADLVPITRLVFFIAPSPRAHLDFLRRLSRIFGRGPVRELLAREAADGEILRAVAAADPGPPAAAEGEGTP
jgi:nitrogen PTS system EIIA component